MNTLQLPSSPASPAAGPAAQWLRWPLPALLAWTAAWLLNLLMLRLGVGDAAAWAMSAAVGAAPAFSVAGRWRRGLMVAGFPLSSLAMGSTAPAWAWLLAALALLLAYPLRAWSDAPFFPTPRRALLALADALPLPAGSRVMDAGCGLGHGLRALRAVWPRVQLQGVEWSAGLAWLCARRCRDAEVRRADMWALPWCGIDVVYLFQRPESMARAWDKACAEMAPASHLVSLEFAVPGVEPLLRLDAGGGRPLWVYRIPARHRSMKARIGR